MKRLLLGLIALLGCVACETEPTLIPPPFEEEIAAYDWTTIDGKEIENRLLNEILILDEKWTAGGGTGWLEIDSWYSFFGKFFKGYILFEDGTGWSCREFWDSENDEDHIFDYFYELISYHIPIEWSFNSTTGVLRIDSDMKDESKGTFYVLSYKGNELIVGEKPSASAENLESTFRIKFTISNDAEKRAAWLEQYARSVDEVGLRDI